MCFSSAARAKVDTWRDKNPKTNQEDFHLLPLGGLLSSQLLLAVQTPTSSNVSRLVNIERL